MPGHYDPDNSVGAGGGAGFKVIEQGGNVSSKLPGRSVATGGAGVGTTTVNDLRGRAEGASSKPTGAAAQRSDFVSKSSYLKAKLGDAYSGDPKYPNKYTDSGQ